MHDGLRAVDTGPYISSPLNGIYKSTWDTIQHARRKVENPNYRSSEKIIISGDTSNDDNNDENKQNSVRYSPLLSEILFGDENDDYNDVNNNQNKTPEKFLDGFNNLFGIANTTTATNINNNNNQNNKNFQEYIKNAYHEEILRQQKKKVY